MKTILLLGVSGMLGNCAFRVFAKSPEFRVIGTSRNRISGLVPSDTTAKLIAGIDISDFDRVVRLFGEVRPDVVVNCVGVIKQLDAARDPLVSISINSLLPHRLAELCRAAGARLVHVSTDCVFDGKKGHYTETDFPDAYDLYGRTKLLGEVDYPNAVTLRTSIIGHELGSEVSLVDWFLSQKGPTVGGYHKAIYSGLPTVELANIIRDVVIPRPELTGVWHVASAPINKFELLKIVARVYGKQVELRADDKVVIDRSLDATRFNSATGYVAPSWDDLVARMHADYMERQALRS